jgi:hypothetical protein
MRKSLNDWKVGRCVAQVAERRQAWEAERRLKREREFVQVLADRIFELEPWRAEGQTCEVGTAPVAGR